MRTKQRGRQCIAVCARLLARGEVAAARPAFSIPARSFSIEAARAMAEASVEAAAAVDYRIATRDPLVFKQESLANCFDIFAGLRKRARLCEAAGGAPAARQPSVGLALGQQNARASRWQTLARLPAPAPAARPPAAPSARCAAVRSDDHLVALEAALFNARSSLQEHTAIAQRAEAEARFLMQRDETMQAARATAVAEIDRLKARLSAARAERANKDEREALAQVIAALPAKERLLTETAAARDAIRSLTEAIATSDSVVARRRAQFAALLASLKDLAAVLGAEAVGKLEAVGEGDGVGSAPGAQAAAPTAEEDAEEDNLREEGEA
ncbi:unnamed protein product [Symbiodinium sp. KB8]|nr:unnamed protein product [Symbiodinium sp. KB8]